jgi:hypothetical protein
VQESHGWAAICVATCCGVLRVIRRGWRTATTCPLCMMCNDVAGELANRSKIELHQGNMHARSSNMHFRKGIQWLIPRALAWAKSSNLPWLAYEHRSACTSHKGKQQQINVWVLVRFCQVMCNANRMVNISFRIWTRASTLNASISYQMLLA